MTRPTRFVTQATRRNRNLSYARTHGHPADKGLHVPTHRGGSRCRGAAPLVDATRMRARKRSLSAMHAQLGNLTRAWTPEAPPEPGNGYLLRVGIAHLLAGDTTPRRRAHWATSPQPTSTLRDASSNSRGMRDGGQSQRSCPAHPCTATSRPLGKNILLQPVLAGNWPWPSKLRGEQQRHYRSWRPPSKCTVECCPQMIRSASLP